MFKMLKITQCCMNQIFVCVASTVLPSIKKIRYTMLHQLSCLVKAAYCKYPAGLSGCWNHVTGTLYCLEDYIYQDLQKEEKKGCTNCLQAWNQPRLRNVTGCPTDKVKLTKTAYGIERRPKLHSIKEWDCQPLSRRIIDPNKAQNLKDSLSSIREKN